MIEVINGIEYDVIPMNHDKLYCTYLNHEVKRHGWYCSPALYNPKSQSGCLTCCYSREIITAEFQRHIDSGYAKEVIDRNGKKYVIQK